jgi:radical SAM superfamily enzyme YgiQ (UPF0313 family)
MMDFELFAARERVDRLAGARGEKTKPLTVCLVTALSLADFVDPELTSQGAGQFMAGNIGVLTLAAILREKGQHPEVVNLDCLFLDFLGRNGDQRRGEAVARSLNTPQVDGGPVRGSEPGSSADFFHFAMERLKALSFDVFGFSSICSSYPLTLRLAQQVKALNPNSLIILGGPQASVVDEPTMQAFPCIDFVLRGEADRTFPDLLEILACRDRSGKLESLPGLTFRRGDDVIRNPNAPAVEDLDLLPLPAFDLDPDLKKRDCVYLELGRGCPFACTFCSTNDFFRRNFRLKSPQKMVQEMNRVKEESGIGNFSLIHDMFTVDRKRVAAFCDAVLASGGEFTWACSARTDCIDDELIDLMARAGCRGIFFGIETGSERLQRAIGKNLDLLEAMQRIECADRHGIKTAVALITAFPDETRDDLRDTIHFFVDSFRFDHAEPQLSLLAPLAGTPIHAQYKDQLALDYLFSDMSHQGWQQDSADLEMIKLYPDVFPNFYAVPTSCLPRGYFKEIRDFVTYLTTWFRWLPIALLQDSGDLLKVFDRWRAWLAGKKPEDSGPDLGAAPYYCRRRFRHDFLEFVRTCYLGELARARTAIGALLQAEGGGEIGESIPASAGTEAADAFDAAYFPFQARELVVMDLPVDYKDLIERLRTKAGLDRVLERKVTIVFRPKDQRRIEVWQLAPSSAALMRLCDGKRTVREIVGEFASLGADADGVPVEKACLFGLMLLRQEGLIGISRSPVVGAEDVGVRGGKTSSILRYSPPPQMSNTQQPWPWPSFAGSPRQAPPDGATITIPSSRGAGSE